jgi:glutamate N-acetyltransferase/amino-acid N-acetyltransferase
MSYRVIEDGHVSSPPGFRATGVSCGLKEVKARDLALVYSTQPARVAALFTTNAILAAPIFFNQAVLSRNREAMRAVLINAGQANAGTGQTGLTNAIECAKITADELDVPRDSVLLLSTGKIGAPLPMDRMRDGIRRAASELDSGGGRRAALAILTTETRPKERALSLTLRGGRTVVLAGMAKGGRLVYPRQATLLCVLTTNLAIDTPLLPASLEASVRQSFGRVALDGEASPNDAVILLANGAAAHPPIADVNSYEFGAWQEALDALCADLAQQIVRDAATGGKFVQVQTRGASSEEDARRIALAVARSSSVRWACANAAADWGGILSAVGSSGVAFRPDLLELWLGSVPVMLEGSAVPFDPTAAIQALSGSDIELTIDLLMGLHQATIWISTNITE